MYIYVYYDELLHEYFYNISKEKNANLGIFIKKINIKSYDWLMFLYENIKNFKYTKYESYISIIVDEDIKTTINHFKNEE